MYYLQYLSEYRLTAQSRDLTLLWSKTNQIYINVSPIWTVATNISRVVRKSSFLYFLVYFPYLCWYVNSFNVIDIIQDFRIQIVAYSDKMFIIFPTQHFFLLKYNKNRKIQSFIVKKESTRIHQNFKKL